MPVMMPGGMQPKIPMMMPGGMPPQQHQQQWNQPPQQPQQDSFSGFDDGSNAVAPQSAAPAAQAAPAPAAPSIPTIEIDADAPVRVFPSDFPLRPLLSWRAPHLTLSLMKYSIYFYSLSCNHSRSSSSLPRVLSSR
jgi:hypothetical protein